MSSILMDIDGVLLRAPHFYTRLMEKNEGYEDAEAILSEFYRSHSYLDCVRGINDTAQEIQPYLHQLSWKQSVSDYFDQQARWEQFYLDRLLLHRIDALRADGRSVYIATDQEAMRSERFGTTFDLYSHFDGCFISSELGATKAEDAYWEQVAENINIEHCVFYDDRTVNIEAARRFEIDAKLYRSRNDFGHWED